MCSNYCMKKFTAIFLGSILTLSASMAFIASKTMKADFVAYAEEATSITATATKTFYVGETITSDDIYVEDNLGNEIVDFTFANEDYRFTYEEENSGGSLVDVTFENAITGGGFTCSLTAQVQRKDYFDTRYDVIPSDIYGAWQNAGISMGKSFNQYNNGGANYDLYGHMASDADYAMVLDSYGGSRPHHYGIISVKSDKNALAVRAAWNDYTSNGAILSIYGKNTPYSETDDLFDELTCGTLLGTIIKGTSSSLIIEGEYKYVGICVKEAKIAYLDSVTVIYDNIETPENVANYIMHEDTNNQCLTKFDVAKGRFETLTKEERATFMSSDNYVIDTARDRLEHWATALGKTINLENGDYVIVDASIVRTPISSTTNDIVAIVIVIASISMLALAGYLLFKKKTIRQ